MSAPFRFDATVSAPLIEWRGPAPDHFLRLPDGVAASIAAIAPLVTYGWGVIPVRVRIGATAFTTSLIPRDGGYLLPVKDAVRRAERLELGEVIEAAVTVGD